MYQDYKIHWETNIWTQASLIPTQIISLRIFYITSTVQGMETLSYTVETALYGEIGPSSWKALGAKHEICCLYSLSLLFKIRAESL